MKWSFICLFGRVHIITFGVKCNSQNRILHIYLIIFFIYIKDKLLLCIKNKRFHATGQCSPGNQETFACNRKWHFNLLILFLFYQLFSQKSCNNHFLISGKINFNNISKIFLTINFLISCKINFLKIQKKKIWMEKRKKL